MSRLDQAIALEETIRFQDKKYWEDNDPVVEDFEYDNNVKSLLKLEPDNEYLNRPKAPKVDSQGKVTHSIPMLSLDKAYSWEEIIKFCDRVCRNDDEFLKVMYKLDGVSGQLMYGILATRGNGEIGEDITHKLPFMEIVTHGDPDNVRGEILFTKQKFKEIKGVITRKSGEDYKNERNAVGGVLSRDDLEPVQILSFVDFEYVCFDCKYSELKELSEEGWNRMCKDAKESEYPTDGLVIKVADEEYAKTLGATRHHLKSAISFKFENPHEWSILREIEFSPGKHDITPVGKIDPVEISGATIASPSLHNWKNILDRDLHIGDHVKVERAGDVIPYISDSKPGDKRTPIVIPPCPICNSEVVYNDPQLECSNSECPGKLLNKLSDAVIRIGIDRLGKPTIQKMVDTLKVENLIDIFNVTMDDLLTLEGFKEKSTENLFKEINKVKEEGVYEWQLLAALNIQGIGRSLSKDLLADRALIELGDMTESDLVKLPNIGEERAVLIVEGLKNNWDYLGRLHAILPIKNPVEVKPVDTDLIKVCFTGRFPEKKSYYYDQLEARGGYEIMEKVNKETQVLVVADTSKESNKMKAAKKKGIKIMGIDDLIEV